MVESNIGVLCACIPVMGPALQAVFSISPFSSFRPRPLNDSQSTSTNDTSESQPLPPLPSSSPDEEAGLYRLSRGIGAETTENIVRLGHLLELYDWQMAREKVPHDRYLE